MIRYALGLGSNVGDRLAHLRFAVECLGEVGRVSAVSSLYESAPVGGPVQGPFLNAVVVVESDLEPLVFLDRLQEIETEAGRVRETRWGPRTLDLDIVSSDGDPVSEETLEIPHPRAAEREFVLRPLVEVWPEARVAPDKRASDALEEIGNQGVDRLVRVWGGDDQPWLGRLFVGLQFAWFLGIALAMASEGTLPEVSVDVTRIVGGMVAVIGAALALISSRRLGPGITALPEPRSDAVLIETGPYALARHPIYGGVTLLILGAAMIADSLTGVFLSLGLLPFFYLKSEYEERTLRIRYPEYRGYRERVTRRLIPFLI
ncbi:MAG: 2-amino-4-hydroxy-6-hydroxymethyldihydropteridine diphosphokinase [Acidobacteria bacterium]|nr:2-amino-4-hydroxy-6-hydroxymethyldihydropteridine diphosphokinase [Acidobacteriota bacterium]